MFQFTLLLVSTFVFALLLPSSHGAEPSVSMKVPPVQEALVPYAFHAGIQSKLNPPFPLEEQVPAFKGVQAISQKQYQNYWLRWKPLSGALESFHTLFTEADAGKDAISVQYLSARIANFKLLYHKHFDSMPRDFKAFESFRALESLVSHLEELAYILKQQGRMDVAYRPYANDVEEEQLVYQRHFRQVRQNLDQIYQIQDIQNILTTGFRKNDK
jgi:hypothetical protein